MLSPRNFPSPATLALSLIVTAVVSACGGGNASDPTVAATSSTGTSSIALAAVTSDLPDSTAATDTAVTTSTDSATEGSDGLFTAQGVILGATGTTRVTVAALTAAFTAAGIDPKVGTALVAKGGNAPMIQSGLMPAINVLKVPAKTTTAFTGDRVQTTDELAPVSDIGAFRTTCDFSHMSFDDPIVYPGQPGKSHLHAFFGNTGTNANSTAASIANSGNSTCRGGTVNRTWYWVPAMIDTRDGTPIQPLSLQAYYKTGYNGVRSADIKPFPLGLRMITGEPAASVPYASLGRYNCDLADGSNSGNVGMIPDCKPSTGLLVNIDFPQCWDGVNLDSPDHKSHMAFADAKYVLAPANGAAVQWGQVVTTTTGCPPTHPVALPLISMGVWYQTPATAHDVLRWRLASDNYDSALPGGYSVHADWFNGWKPDVMNAFATKCDAASKDCHSHLLGDGRMIY